MSEQKELKKNGLKSMSEQKERYFLFKYIVDICINNNCIIFGGFVRDSIIHQKGASEYYLKKHTTAQYSNETVDPETFKDRNTYAKDIDIFLNDLTKWDNIENELKNNMSMTITRNKEKTLSNYNNHPYFILNFTVTRFWYSYYYNCSFQNKSRKIDFNIDIVSNTYNSTLQPWSVLIDCASNTLYLDKHGIHSNIENFGIIDKYSQIHKLIELTKNKITFIPTPPASYINPSSYTECAAIAFRSCISVDEASLHNTPEYRVRYRIKLIKRLAKTFQQGFSIINSPIEFAIYSDKLDSSFCNDESCCCISQDDFRTNDLIMRLKGSRSVMLYESFLKHLSRPTPIVLDDLGGDFWSISCPVTRIKVPIFDNFCHRDFLNLSSGDKAK